MKAMMIGFGLQQLGLTAGAVGSGDAVRLD